MASNPIKKTAFAPAPKNCPAIKTKWQNDKDKKAPALFPKTTGESKGKNRQKKPAMTAFVSDPKP